MLDLFQKRRLRMTSQQGTKNCCALIMTETCLNFPDSAVELIDYTLFCADRTSDAGKKVGGGLCIYVNNAWCTNAAIMVLYIVQLCTSD